MVNRFWTRSPKNAPAALPAGVSRKRGATASLIVLSALAIGGLHSGSQVTAQTASISLSPEEAVIQLIPYRLTQADLPQGYLLNQQVSVDTPSTFAVGADDPTADLALETAAHFLVQAEQQADATTEESGQLSVGMGARLFADAASTSGYVAGEIFPLTDPKQSGYDTAQPVDLGTTYGDASRAWHVTYTGTDPGKTPGAGYLVRWRRGPVAFRVVTSAFAGKERLDDLRTLMTAIDAKYAAVPAPEFGAPTVTPPATEAQRLQAGLKLQALGFTASPDGYGFTSIVASHPAQFIYDDVNPVAELRLLDQVWKRLIGYAQTFTNTSDSARMATIIYAQDADAAAAKADVSDFQVGPNESATVIDAGIQLGDLTTAHRVTGVYMDGSAYEFLDLSWVHGPVLLEVQMTGQPGSTSLPVLTALARQLEANYQASPYASGQ